MKKKVIAVILAMSMAISSCGLPGNLGNSGNDASKSGSTSESTSNASGTDQAESGDESEKKAASYSASDVQALPLMGEEEEIYYDESLVPSVPAYTIASDFSNVKYVPELQYSLDIQYDDEETHRVSKLRDALTKNGFAVVDYNMPEFFSVYESNRYSLIPNLVTVDSLMHTYHLYFSYLMKNTEKNFLEADLRKLGSNMLNASYDQYAELKGTEWEQAVLKNIEFFAIGNLLLNETVTFDFDEPEVDNNIQAELDKIYSAEGIDDNLITGLKEDYSQYKVRGYYEGDEVLEQYFRAMMWYGRMAFSLDDKEQVKCAALMTSALSTDPELWQKIYRVTSFFAGSADDVCFDRMAAAVEESYGGIPGTKELASDKASFDKLLSSVKELEPPQINSIPVMEGEDPVIPSFRFMGQRFTVDAAIMQKLIYSAVEENAAGEKRYLPDTLDTAAALGSEEAHNILKEQGDTDYQNFEENLLFVSEHFNNSDASIWNASLYSGWLNTLRPLLEEKKEGYPSFMQSEEWVRKDLETFAGSYAELKHDTVLYSKQVMAEMGGGDIEECDDRGYVQPEPVVYSRFINLSKKTKEGLEELGMLKDSDKENLDRLTGIAQKLLAMSEKELRNETLSDEEYEFIREYGGDLEHFWLEVHSDEPDASLDSDPCSIITDIATDPNGSILEIGTGGADAVFVVFPIDGELHVARGSVYNFYQFEMPLSDRLTDEEWRNMLRGGYMDDNWNWIETQGAPDKPEWTMGYRTGN